MKAKRNITRGISLVASQAATKASTELFVHFSKEGYMFVYCFHSGLSIHDEPVQLACAGDHSTLVLSGLDMMHVG